MSANHTLVLNADMAPMSYLPLSTISWSSAIKAVFLGSVTVVEEYEDWEVHSPSTTMRVPSVIMTKQFMHYQRAVSFNEDNIALRDRYTCQYCHRVFPFGRKLTHDHVLPRKHGGKTTWDNITSSCAPCNFRKGHDRRIVPKVLPRKPSYYELIAIAREYPLEVPCESWVNYLEWPQDNILVKGRKILPEQLAA